jgi:glycosyltransferase involved in cell wall biosynthesis
LVRHWAINGRFASQSITGVQRYAHEIVGMLDRLLTDNASLADGLDVELLVPPGTTAPELDAIRVRTVGRIGGHAWEQAVLPVHARGGLISLCNTGPVLHRNQIVCIHDLSTRVCPQSYSRPFRALYRVLMPALGRTARAVFTVSEYSAGELDRFGVRPLQGISVAPNGHEHALRWVPAHSERTRRVATRDTVVLLGSPAPHKNAGLVVGLSERLARAGLRIAVVGAADPRVFSTAISERDGAGVEWLGRVSDGELTALLQDCLCLAFPSLTEGFGLPALEAMAVGCPVVASDRASLPEVCGDAALYAPPDDADAWFDRLIELHASPRRRADLIARGKAQASRYRWSQSAGRYLLAMAEADGLPWHAPETGPAVAFT